VRGESCGNAAHDRADENGHERPHFDEPVSADEFPLIEMLG
jgi:hypothetical protein